MSCLERSLALLAYAALVLSPHCMFAQSQANTGTIEGAITDPSGKTIPGAEVTIVNVDTNFTRVLTTDSEGRFRGVLLPLGAYKLTVKAKNFATLIREGINLGVGQTVNLSLSLSIAATEQTISVTGDAPVVETDKVEQSTYIDQQSIRSLPNNGRNFLDFVTLTPGVSIVQGPDG